MKKHLPFIVIMSLFALACAAVTVFAIRNEPQYVWVVPSETERNADATDATVAAKINLNTASPEELQSLPQIGEVRAEAIIAYREQYGGFLYIEELMEVSGIGPALFELLKDLICV